MSEWVLGLDTSTVTGWCVINKDGPIEAGEKKFADLKGMNRVAAFYDWTTKMVEFYAPSSVYIEGYGYGNQHTLATLVEVGTAIRLALHRKRLTPTVITPSQLKKYATGKGNAKKDQIMLAVYKKWRFEAETNNIADAFVLARMAADNQW